MPGRILAIDYGERRLGVAMSDPMRIIAQGLPTITYRTREDALQRLGEVIGEHEIDEVVLGHPLTTGGEAGPAARRVERFCHTLRARFGLPVHLWDERFSSVEAQRIMREQNVSAGRHKGRVDQLSAVLILQAYLNHLNTVHSQSN